MGERTSYEPGTFSWAELVTSDSAAAKAFYTALFGWQSEDTPIPGDGVYTMANIDGKTVAAMYEASDQPPHWNSYVTVAGVDESASRASELGATLLAEPFDVMEVGRMAFLQDPTGAALALWQPRAHIGAGLVNAHGALSWNELATPDPEAAKTFYAALFGWEYQPFQEGYWVIQNAGRANGGLREQMEGEKGMPAYWLVYFGASDTDEAVEKAGANGGGVLAPAMDLPMGRIAVLRDGQGAVFAVYAGQMED